MLLLAADGPPSGLDIDIASKKFFASSKTVAVITDAAERMWSRTLDWASRNPIEFGFVMVVIMFIAVQRRIGRTETAKMTHQYELQRELVRNQQPSLPLSLPTPLEPRE